MSAVRTVDARKLELGKIHAGAQQLGMIRKGDDSVYRDMLFTLTGNRSASGLDAEGRQIVLAHLQGQGASYQAPRFARARYRKGTPAALVRWIWTCLFRAKEVRDDSDAGLWIYCRAELSRTLKVEESALPAALQFISNLHCSILIEHLKKWCDRSGVAWQ